MTHFAHAVLELKLQLETEQSGLPPQPPAWVGELLASGCLIDAPKFSKFVHGTAMFYQVSRDTAEIWPRLYAHCRYCRYCDRDALPARAQRRQPARARVGAASSCLLERN